MSEPELKRSDILALERNKLASERTLMAWIRTALTMIGFGFTMFKFLQAIQEHSAAPVLRPDAPRNLGVTLVGMGTLAVLVACVQHRKYVHSLRADKPYPSWDLPLTMATLVGLLGILMLVGIVIRVGFFY